MDPVTALQRLGGVATYGELLGPTTRSELLRALRDDRIIKVRRNRYALVDTDEQVRRAVALGGVLSHLSAAQRYDWKVKHARPSGCASSCRGARAPRARTSRRAGPTLPTVTSTAT
ncbi:hypothetical protein [Nocardioides sp. Soil805]|uniref:hypothetical protein n=1 Tax=Nocardioides sp. Soil805 TaxID=1736416 RepID=UPI000702605B|nr:hypothetical protein [Nocardioides sp. Soil805]KRF35075.1 hypothetical protein ASG94_13165 [Nocardioides sp. Soil805]